MFVSMCILCLIDVMRISDISGSPFLMRRGLLLRSDTFTPMLEKK